MQLKLSVSSVQGPSLGQDAVAWFRLRGGTIGRARDNDWVLPDAERIVSGHHARILYEQGSYYLEDTSSNGTFLNGQDSPIPPGQLTELQHGDLLAIGDYEIRVEIEEDSAPAAATLTDSPPPPEQMHEFVAKPYAPPVDNSSQAEVNQPPTPDPDCDPWAAQHYPESTQPRPSEDWGGVQGDHLAPDAINFHPPSASPELIPTDGENEVPDEILPDDWWKIDDETADVPTASPSTESPQPSEAPLPPEPELPQPAAPSAATPPPSVDPSSAAAPQAEPRSQSPLPPRPEPQQPEPQQLAPPPEHPHSEPPPPTPQSDSAASDTPVPAASTLVDAYFEGLGLQAPTLTPEEAERVLRQTGRLLRIMTDGLMEVLKTRSTLKGEFRLSQTIVQSAENNPLKFCIDAQQALAQLFIDQRAGFMAPEASFSEAITDIKQHQLAVIAGMRAAFDCLLDKFEPDTIEAARNTAGKRRTGFLADKQWAFYRDYHANFKANAGDDFQGIFGEDFVRAYEAQIRRLMAGGGEDV